MKNTLTLLRELTARFPPGDDEMHSVVFSPAGDDMSAVKGDALRIDIRLAGISRIIHTTLLPGDYEKSVEQLVEEIASVVTEEIEWWRNDDGGNECQHLEND